MKGFDVLHVKSSVKSRNEFDLSRTHLTTMDFGQIVPLFVEETVPGDKINVGANYFSRTAPLVKPTYGKFSFKTVTGFVPYHQIAFDADAWISGKTSFEGSTPHHRYFTVGDLHNFVLSYCCNAVEGTATNADYFYTDSSAVAHYMVFTNEGRYFVKILNALGYALPSTVTLDTSSVWWTKVRLTKLSAYPLLAFMKLYNDYMSQSQRFNTSALSSFLQNVKYGKTQAGYSVSSGQLSDAGIYALLSNLWLCYENDYFTSAWQDPNKPVGGSTFESINSLSVPSGEGSTVTFGRYDTKVDVTVADSVASIGQRALNFLRSFDDWVRRNDYSGSRVVQQIYSRFGIKTDDFKTHYAHVYKTDVMPVQVGDVTATADTSNAALGDYAGKAVMAGDSSASVEVSDFGLFIILGYVTVRPMNSYGSDRRVLRNAPLDYYTPEFDGIGAEAISVGEFYASPIDYLGTTADTAVYGFTERYNSYRYGRDVITGDFRNFHSDSEMNTWHTGRNLTYVRDAGALVAQSASVVTMHPIDSEYNRIFSITSGDVDHFYLTCNFNVKAIRPMLNLNQVVNLGEGDTTVPRNGVEIS